MAKQKFYSLWLCLVCIVVFILQLIIPGFEDALILNNKAIYNYEIWRFLTAIFLHGGIAHLLYNLLALALFGIILEKFVGSRNFLIVFFGSGIFANIISVNFYESSLGASGAIYGILGCLTLIQPGMMVWAFGLPMPMFIAAILWTAGSVLGIFMPGNTGHIAHLSGILIGLIFGIFIRMKMPRKIKKQKIEIPEAYLREWENRYVR
jgi:membrane associated rhomboid family serine protease